MGKLYVRYNGKMSREDGIYVRRNGNQDITIRRKEGYQYTRSDEQGRNRASFGKRSARVAAWRRANSDPPSPEYKRLQQDYELEHKRNPNRYMSFWHYLVANLPICDETIKDEKI